MHSFLLCYKASLRDDGWLCNTWLLHGWAVRSFSTVFTGINKRKQETLQDIKLSKQKKIQSYHYWTHNDLSPFLQLKCLQLFQHKKDLSKRGLFLSLRVNLLNASGIWSQHTSVNIFLPLLSLCGTAASRRWSQVKRRNPELWDISLHCWR